MIYPILDLSYCSDPLRVANECVRAKVPLLQLRGKNARYDELAIWGKKIRDITISTSTKFIVNDSIKLAQLIKADGVHLGQQDCSIKTARKILGNGAIIGKSLMDGNKDMDIEEANYISFGPVFATPRRNKNPIGLQKLGKLVEWAKGRSKIIFGIGGINARNCVEVMRTGCDGIAVIGAICQVKEPCSSCIELMRLCKNR